MILGLYSHIEKLETKKREGIFKNGKWNFNSS